jgi:acetyl esterase/lipase
MRRCNRRTAIGVAGAVAASLVGCAGVARAPHARGDVAPLRYAYGDDPSQYAEISLPAGTAPAPVVIVIHGGYWQAGYGAELGRPLAVDLAARGFAAVNVEYRRIGNGGGWPQTGQDVLDAVSALRNQADGRLDLTRVVALGHSAGGQLAGWLASRRDVPVPLTGAVLQAGVLDLVRGAEQGLGGGSVDEFLGGTPQQRPEAYAQASPIGLVPLGVPTVCIHGSADFLVPAEQSERFVAAAQRAGDTSTLQAVPGDHFAVITVGTPAWDACVAAVSAMTATGMN